LEPAIGPTTANPEMVIQSEFQVQQKSNHMFSSASSTSDVTSLPSYQSVLELGYASDVIVHIIQQLSHQGM